MVVEDNQRLCVTVDGGCTTQTHGRTGTEVTGVGHDVETCDLTLQGLVDGLEGESLQVVHLELLYGSGELADGIKKFNDEGISKLISIVDGDLGSIIDRFNAVSDLSETYGTFSGGSGSVKFIYRTDEIEKS